jgi:hypothetical protein
LVTHHGLSNSSVDFCLWHVAPFRCEAEFVANGGVADIDRATPINLD